MRRLAVALCGALLVGSVSACASPPEAASSGVNGEGATARETATGAEPASTSDDVVARVRTVAPEHAEEVLSDPHGEAPAEDESVFGDSTAEHWLNGMPAAKRRDIRAAGGSRHTAPAVARGLDWLASSRRGQHGWPGTDAHHDRPELAIAVGAEALLAFLADGNTHRHGRHRRAAKDAAKLLRGWQEASGSFVPEGSEHARFVDSRATLAKIELYGMTGSRLFLDSSRRALANVLRAHPPYAPALAAEPTWDAESLYLLWVLRSARLAELDLPAEIEGAAVARDRARAWIDAAAEGEGELSRDDVIRLAWALMVEWDGVSADRRRGAHMAVARRLVDAARPAGGLDDDGLELATLLTPVLLHVGGAPWKRWNEGLRGLLSDDWTERPDPELIDLLRSPPADPVLATARLTRLYASYWGRPGSFAQRR